MCKEECTVNIILYKRILTISKKLQKELKKNGKGFKHQYFRTEDIVPNILDKCSEYDIGYMTHFTTEYAQLFVFQTDDDKAEIMTYQLPLVLKEDSTPEKTVQLIGKMQTYYTRYLLIQAFNICEVDEIELVNPDKPKNKFKAREPQTENLSKDELNKMFNKIRKQCPSDDFGCFERKVWACYDMKYINDHDRMVLFEMFKSQTNGGDNM